MKNKKKGMEKGGLAEGWPPCCGRVSCFVKDLNPPRPLGKGELPNRSSAIDNTLHFFQIEFQRLTLKINF
jgi:hypothetical protein